MNNLNITGRIGQDITTRKAGTNTVASCSVAVRRKFVKSGGVDTDWFRIEAWGKEGEYLINYGAKGRLLAVTGSIQFREHDGKTYHDVKADHVELLDRGNDQATTTDDSVDPFA
jgi:single-strand DNA-binding protein